MDTSELLNKKVSFQTTSWAPLSKELTIQEVLNEIKSSKHLSQIQWLRTFINNEELELYNIHKKNLPAVTFCGTFEGKRKKEFLKRYNEIVVIDIDKLSEDEFTRINSVLEKDDFVFAYWVSPSNKGIKGLISVSFAFERNDSEIDIYHKLAFKKLQSYFLDNYNITLDESGSDTTRLCFLSYDLKLCQKNTYKSFIVNETVIEAPRAKKKASLPKSVISKEKSVKIITNRNALYNPENKNSQGNRKSIQSIIKYLEKNKSSITYTYEEWYRVAIAIANSFTFDIGLKYFLSLSKMDKEKYNAIDCENILLYSYENSKGVISFKTIEYLALQKGYKILNQKGAVPKMALISRKF